MQGLRKLTPAMSCNHVRVALENETTQANGHGNPGGERGRAEGGVYAEMSLPMLLAVATASRYADAVGTLPCIRQKSRCE